MPRTIRRKEHVEPKEVLSIPTPEPSVKTTKTVAEKSPGIPTWKKLGGGSFRLASGKIIKPNQVFQAYESEIPKAFRDCVKMVEGVAESASKPIKKVKASVYKINSIGETEDSLFNVVGENGKSYNERPLSFEEAEDLVEALQKA